MNRHGTAPGPSPGAPGSKGSPGRRSVPGRDRRGRGAALLTFAAAALGTLASGCLGVEADVLSLRPPPDMAGSPDLAKPVPSPPDAAPGPACSTEWLSSMICEDPGLWKTKAAAVCMTGGRILGRLDLRDTCDLRGALGARGVSFDCCGAMPPPTTPVCTARMQGDPTSCKEPAIWQQSAALDCQARGEQIDAFALADLCGPDRYRSVKYLCCARVRVMGARPSYGPAQL